MITLIITIYIIGVIGSFILGGYMNDRFADPDSGMPTAICILSWIVFILILIILIFKILPEHPSLSKMKQQFKK